VTQRGDAIRPEAGSVRPEKKVFFADEGGTLGRGPEAVEMRGRKREVRT